MDSKNQVLLIGGGGHCKVVIDVFRAAGWAPIGILDPHLAGADVFGVPVLGGDERASELLEQGHRNAFVAIGENAVRRRIALGLMEIGFELATAIHPSAVISPSARLEGGTIVMPNAVINAHARVGAFGIVNTGAIVEHDCVLGVAVHAAPRSVMGGNVTLEDEVLFGIGAVARPGSFIGARTVVGAGAVVIGTIGADLIAGGAPARPLRGSPAKRTA